MVVVVYWLVRSQLHGLMAGQDVEVDTVVRGSVGGEGGVPVLQLIIGGALDCDDSVRAYKFEYPWLITDFLGHLVVLETAALHALPVEGKYWVSQANNAIDTEIKM